MDEQVELFVSIPCEHAGYKVQCTLANHESYYCACTRQFMLHATHVLRLDAFNYYQAFYEISISAFYNGVNLSSKMCSTFPEYYVSN